MEKLDLQKARGKTLAMHFGKGAAFHEKKADHHEKCMDAHKAMQAHHEEMAGADGADKAHHKAKTNFHKTMAAHHEKCMKLHKAHAEHHLVMEGAFEGVELAGENKSNKPSTSVKAAFAKLGIELTEDASPAVVSADSATSASTTTTTGEPPVIKNTSATDLAATVTATSAATTTTPVAAAATGEPGDLQTAMRDGLRKAVDTGIKEILASPEFKKTMQEQIANALLEQLGQQTAAAPAKTFAVPRNGTSVLEVAKAISTGNTPQLDTTGVAPEFAHLVSLGID
jgi:hypothetical protein